MIRQKSSTLSIAILLLVFIFSSCNLLNQKKFAYLNKVPANPVLVEHQKDFPTPANILENEISEPVFLDYADSNIHDHKKSEPKTSKTDLKKKAEKTIRNLLFPDFGMITAKISTQGSTSEPGPTIALVCLALLIIVILYYVLTKTNVGCLGLVIIIFLIAFLIMGLVM